MTVVQTNQNMTSLNRETPQALLTSDGLSSFSALSIGSIVGAIERTLQQNEGFSYISRPLDPDVRIGIGQWLEARNTGVSVLKNLIVNHSNFDKQSEIMIDEFQEDGLREFLAIEMVRHIFSSAQEYMEGMKSDNVRIFINSCSAGEPKLFHLDEPVANGKRIIRGHEVLSGDGGFLCVPNSTSVYAKAIEMNVQYYGLLEKRWSGLISKREEEKLDSNIFELSQEIHQLVDPLSAVDIEVGNFTAFCSSGEGAVIHSGKSSSTPRLFCSYTGD